jgi:uncharacterized delta-60 repeat protein
MSHRILAALRHLACATLLFLPFAAGAQAGGSYILHAEGYNGWRSAVTLSDRSVVAVGFARFGNRQITLGKYTPTGPLDASFGQDGIAHVDIPGADTDAWRAVLQPDGKILVVGIAASDRERIAVARVNPDGTPDTTFVGGGAFQLTASAVGNSGAYALALAPDGHFYVGGYTNGGSGDAMVIVRFNADGSLDTTYGSNGFATAALGAGRLHSLLLLGDGRLMYGGESSDGSQARVGVLLPNGAFDPAFGAGGARDIANFWGAWDMARQPDGKVVIAGGTPTGTTADTIVAAARILATGELDTSFGSGGIARIFTRSSYSGGRSVGHGILVQSNGTIVVGGIWGTTAGGAGAVNTNGAESQGFFFGVSGIPGMAPVFGLAAWPDGEFALAASSARDGVISVNNASGNFKGSFNVVQGEGGLPKSTDAGAGVVEARAAVQRADGSIVIVGESLKDFRQGFAVSVRPDGSQDSAWGNLRGTTYFAEGTEANAVIVLPDDSVVVGGSKPGANGQDALWMAKLNSRGEPVVLGIAGEFLAPTVGGGALNALALQPDGRIVGAGWTRNPTWRDATFVRVTTNGAQDMAFNGGTGIAIVSSSTGEDLVNDVRLQADGRIVAAGWSEMTGTQDSFAITRLTADGVPDETFGSGGYRTYDFSWQTSHANALAIQPDGQYVLGGTVFNGTTDDFALLRASASGGPDGTFGSGGEVQSDFGNHNRIHGVLIAAGGKIVAVGENGGAFGAARYNPNGTLDTTFGDAGVLRISPSAHYLDAAIAGFVQADGSIWLAGDAEGNPAALHVMANAGTFLESTTTLTSSPNPSQAFQDVTFTATVTGSGGTPSGTVAFRLSGNNFSNCASVPLVNGTATCHYDQFRVGTYSVSATYSGDAAFGSSSDSVTQEVVQPGFVFLSRGTLTFGSTSTGTTSPAQELSLTNGGGVPVTISAITASSSFAQQNDCPATLQPGATCHITVTFTPSAMAGPVNGTANVTGTLTVQASDGNHNANLSGTAEKSLVSHFYQSILRRDADSQGHDFWAGQAQAEIARGANVNEAWYAMAAAFFASPEYAGFNRDDAAFVTDLYETFFNRAPDAQGQAYWLQQLGSGLPRAAALATFMFSTEFRDFTQAQFGNTVARAEVDMVGDFYRGLLMRMPDDGGFAYWVGRFRNAQCQGAAAVSAEAESISSQFVTSGEYSSRARSDVDFVSDLYDAFMRRGADKAGLDFWTGELQSGRQTRDQVRHGFEQSQEFQSRVQAVASQGCMN